MTARCCSSIPPENIRKPSGGIEKQHRVAMGEGKEMLTIVAKLSILDICGDPGYASARAGEEWNFFLFFEK